MMFTLSVSPAVFLLRSNSTSVFGWEAADIISTAGSLFRQSPEKHYGEVKEAYRTSQTAHLPAGAQSRMVKSKVKDLLRLESEDQVEGLQVVRYMPGEYYKTHQDYFVTKDILEYARWLKWLRQEAASLPATVWEADPRLHPESPEFPRALAEEMVRQHMLKHRDAAWLFAAKGTEAFGKRWNNFIAGEMLGRIAAHAYAAAVRDPRLVRPEAPLPRNRLATIFVYLNDDFEGGATGFVDVMKLPSPLPPEVRLESYSLPGCTEGTRVRPRAGDAVFFYNMRPDDAVEPLSQHAACPPTSGVKYGANIWVQSLPERERRREL